MVFLGFWTGGMVGAENATTVPSAGPRKLAPIALAGFRDSAQHWRHIRDDSRFIQADPHQPAHKPARVREIVSNILLFQRANGGWPKDYDMTAVLSDEQKLKVRSTRNHNDASFDNGNLHSQVSYLAHAFAQSQEPSWREACLRGLDFIVSAQYPSGGFPQEFPRPEGFHAHITFNDYVMIGCLHVLKDARDGMAHFAWLDDARRNRARDAVRRGVECILKCQIRVNGRLTGWCQQHDETTYDARPGRTFELASICPQETTEILRFLMRLEKPTKEVAQSVDAAVVWLNDVKLPGVRVKRVKAKREEFPRHTADFDIVVVRDASARPIWARHFEIGTNRPVFAGRDAIQKYALAEIERERRTGTPWYGSWPQRLLEKEYPKWRQNRAVQAK